MTVDILVNFSFLIGVLPVAQIVAQTVANYGMLELFGSIFRLVTIFLLIVNNLL